jgi:hypothetical protein
MPPEGYVLLADEILTFRYGEYPPVFRGVVQRPDGREVYFNTTLDDPDQPLEARFWYRFWKLTARKKAW